MNFDGAGNACIDAQSKIGLSAGDTNSELILEKNGNVFLSADSIITFTVGSSSIVMDNNSVNIKSPNINLNGTTISIKGTTNSIEGENNTISGTNSITGGPTTIDKGKIKLN